MHFNIFVKKVTSLALILFLGGTSCASYDQYKLITQGFDLPQKIFVYDYYQVWNAVIEVIKANNYDTAEYDMETGLIRSKWIDNTLEMNFSDSFGDSTAIKQSRFKIVFNVIKGFKNNREVGKVVIYRRQFVKNDFLQGWKEIPSDSVLEKTLLYRIERILTINKKLKEIEESAKKSAPAAF
jgi:hypothetical protein